MSGLERRVSLADVASAAGVGKATASRALSDRRSQDIGEATRERVRAVAIELGYTPNRAARALRTGRNDSISLVVPVEEWAWWAPVVQGAAVAAGRRNLQLIVHPVQVTSSIDAALAFLNGRGIDGAIVMTNARLERSDLPAPMPVVLIDDLDADPTLPTVRSDNRRGGRDLGRHLIERGRVAPAVFLPNPDAHFAVERLAGFREAYTEAGLEVPPDRVVAISESVTLSPRLHAEVGEAVQRFAGTIDSVFAIADYVAASVLRTLAEAGIAVPDDIAVVGYDDERAALLMNPPLTTMHQPLHEMGAAAVELLEEAIGGTERDDPVIELDGTLVVRAST